MEKVCTVTQFRLGEGGGGDTMGGGRRTENRDHILGGLEPSAGLGIGVQEDFGMGV